MRRFLPIVIVLAVAASCARLPEPGPSPAAALPDTLWLYGHGVWHLRQSVLFEQGGRRVPLQGFLELDTGRGTARLVGLDDLGLTLFRLTVTPQKVETASLSPALPRGEAFAAAVADGVRRVYLEPRPEQYDTLHSAAGTLRFGRDNRGRSFTLTLGTGGEVVLKEASGGGESWRVSYSDYRDAGGVLVPGIIVLEDGQAGWRLTIWQESAWRAGE